MPHWKQAIRKGATLAVVTLLHLLIFVYLTMPQKPTYWNSPATMPDRTGALQLVFLKRSVPATDAATPHANLASMHAAPHASQAVTSTTTSLPKALDIPRPAATAQPKDEDSHSNVDASEAATAADSAYGNPMLKAFQQGSQAQEHPRIPGHADGELVKTISVGEELSPRQILQEGGKFLNCSQVRMARVLSASEMDKRHITTQELDQAFTEFGCT
jgi:hypothetical protein